MNKSAIFLLFPFVAATVADAAPPKTGKYAGSVTVIRALPNTTLQQKTNYKLSALYDGQKLSVFAQNSIFSDTHFAEFKFDGSTGTISSASYPNITAPVTRANSIRFTFTALETTYDAEGQNLYLDVTFSIVLTGTGQ